MGAGLPGLPCNRYPSQVAYSQRGYLFMCCNHTSDCIASKTLVCPGGRQWQSGQCSYMGPDPVVSRHCCRASRWLRKTLTPENALPLSLPCCTSARTPKPPNPSPNTIMATSTWVTTRILLPLPPGIYTAAIG